MFAHIVSLLQIVAIVVCPLGCGKGLCHATLKGEGKQAAELVCLENRVPQCCCCCQKSSTPNKNTTVQSPENTCQGVCGGAVIDKPVELDLALFSILTSHLGTPVESPILITACRWLEVEHVGHGHGGNYGRFVRTIHRSFLC